MNCSIEVFLAKIFDKIVKIQIFFIEKGRKYAFSSIFLKFAKRSDLENLTQTL